ncbi:hypothetical protein Acr_01g0000170 [Actinidia rufa]|uniref:CCHC-type domain-containing protein n=1 Tax=Actinidia rufa TaxID=165716 RepID=A0A7J0E1D1_9ERIC|nr:hypothetical protein Acr_01g0000170 [Actinidia rufa]
MDRSEVARPIIITLDGPNNIPWSQAMFSFLKGRKLWRYVTGDIKAPTQGAAETPTDLQFGRFDTAHTIWDFLATRYTTADLACQYQLLTSLCRQRQDPGQSISAFLPQIYSIWDQLTPSEPKWLCTGDSTLFALIEISSVLFCFLWGSLIFMSRFEPLSFIAFLFPHWSRLSLSCFSTSSTQSSGSASRHSECTFCHATNHRLLTCPVRFCQYCRKKGPGHYKSDCPNNPTRRYARPQSTAATVGVSSSASAPPTLIDVSNLPTLVQQILSASGNPSTALSASSDVDVLLLLFLMVLPMIVSPPLVYPVESPSTDPAPSVAPPAPLPFA